MARPISAAVVECGSPINRARDLLLTNRLHRPNTAADVDDPAATLTVRDSIDGPRTTIAPRSLALRPRNGGRRSRGHDGCGSRRLRAGRFYELVYRTAFARLWAPAC